MIMLKINIASIFMKKSDSEILRKFSKKPYWRLSTAVDLYNCNPQTIRSEAKIKEFVLK